MNYYDETAEGYNKLHGDEQLRKLKVMAEKLQVKKEDKLLDVGCGTGLSFQAFECEWTGLDPSEELLKQCEGKTVKGVAEKLPFEDNSFDVVLCVSSLHNFNDPEKGIEEIKRVGKNKFGISIFKKGADKSKTFWLKTLVEENFDIKKVITDEHDIIYICR